MSSQSVLVATATRPIATVSLYAPVDEPEFATAAVPIAIVVTARGRCRKELCVAQLAHAFARGTKHFAREKIRLLSAWERHPVTRNPRSPPPNAVQGRGRTNPRRLLV